MAFKQSVSHARLAELKGQGRPSWLPARLVKPNEKAAAKSWDDPTHAWEVGSGCTLCVERGVECRLNNTRAITCAHCQLVGPAGGCNILEVSGVECTKNLGRRRLLRSRGLETRAPGGAHNRNSTRREAPTPLDVGTSAGAGENHPLPSSTSHRFLGNAGPSPLGFGGHPIPGFNEYGTFPNTGFGPSVNSGYGPSVNAPFAPFGFTGYGPMAFGGNVGPGNAGYAAPGHNSNPFLGDAGAWTGGSRDAGSGLHGFGQQQVTPTNPFTTFSAGTADYPMANRGTADVLVPVPTGASAGALRDTREVHASGQGLQSSGINTVGDPKGKGHNARREPQESEITHQPGSTANNGSTSDDDEDTRNMLLDLIRPQLDSVNKKRENLERQIERLKKSRIDDKDLMKCFSAAASSNDKARRKIEELENNAIAERSEKRRLIKELVRLSQRADELKKYFDAIYYARQPSKERIAGDLLSKIFTISDDEEAAQLE